MPAKTHTTAAVVIPPPECWEPIQAIRSRYDKQVRRWMPHITLLYPFRPREQFADLTPALREVCATLAPFEIRLVRFRHFVHGRDRFTLWLKPEPAEPLTALHAALLRVVPDCDNTARFPNGFIPHLSVGQVRGRTALQPLIDQLTSTFTPVLFTVRTVSLIWRNDPPDDVFRVGRTIPLGT